LIWRSSNWRFLGYYHIFFFLLQQIFFQGILKILIINNGQSIVLSHRWYLKLTDFIILPFFDLLNMWCCSSVDVNYAATGRGKLKGARRRNLWLCILWLLHLLLCTVCLLHFWLQIVSKSLFKHIVFKLLCRYLNFFFITSIVCTCITMMVILLKIVHFVYFILLQF